MQPQKQPKTSKVLFSISPPKICPKPSETTHFFSETQIQLPKPLPYWFLTLKLVSNTSSKSKQNGTRKATISTEKRSEQVQVGLWKPLVLQDREISRPSKKIKLVSNTASRSRRTEHEQPQFQQKRITISSNRFFDKIQLIRILLNIWETTRSIVSVTTPSYVESSKETRIEV